MRRELERRVRLRARDRCEYCRMPAAFDVAPFQVDHVVARQHVGKTDIANLALSCAYCNAHKGPNLSGIDPKTKRMARLFHPRKDAWRRHFRFRGPRVTGLTAIGRGNDRGPRLQRPGERQPPGGTDRGRRVGRGVASGFTQR